MHHYFGCSVGCLWINRPPALNDYFRLAKCTSFTIVHDYSCRWVGRLLITTGFPLLMTMPAGTGRLWTAFTSWTKYTTFALVQCRAAIDHNTHFALIGDARFSAWTTTLGAASNACRSLQTLRAERLFPLVHISTYVLYWHYTKLRPNWLSVISST
jgi:hypothetical protein